MAIPRNARERVARTTIRLALLSLVVGLVLSLFGLSPAELLATLGSTAESVFRFAVSIVEWAVPYLLLGAVIVVPIWLLLLGWRLLRGRKG